MLNKSLSWRIAKIAGAVVVGLLVLSFIISTTGNFLGGSLDGGSIPSSSGTLGIGAFGRGSTDSNGSLVGDSGISVFSGRMAQNEAAVNSVSPAVDRSVIKTGALTLFVENVETSAEDVKAIAQQLNGFVAHVNIQRASDDTKAGSVTIRVPADLFDEAMIAAKALAVDVEREQVSTQDVTEQVIDIEAHLKNLRAQEESFLGILNDAKEIEDILQVQQLLNNVRFQIERLEAQQRNLAEKIDLATITAHLTAYADVEVFGLRWRPLIVAKQALHSLLERLTGYVDSMIGLAFWLVSAAVWIVTLSIFAFIVWRLGRRLWPWLKRLSK